MTTARSAMQQPATSLNPMLEPAPAQSTENIDYMVPSKMHTDNVVEQLRRLYAADHKVDVSYSYRGVTRWMRTRVAARTAELGFPETYHGFRRQDLVNLLNSVTSTIMVACLGRELSPVAYFWTMSPRSTWLHLKDLSHPPDELSWHPDQCPMHENNWEKPEYGSSPTVLRAWWG